MLTDFRSEGMHRPALTAKRTKRIVGLGGQRPPQSAERVQPLSLIGHQPSCHSSFFLPAFADPGTTREGIYGCQPTCSTAPRSSQKADQGPSPSSARGRTACLRRVAGPPASTGSAGRLEYTAPARVVRSLPPARSGVERGTSEGCSIGRADDASMACSVPGRLAASGTGRGSVRVVHMLMVGAPIVHQQLDDVRDRDLAFNRDQIVTTPLFRVDLLFAVHAASLTPNVDIACPRRLILLLLGGPRCVSGPLRGRMRPGWGSASLWPRPRPGSI